MTRAVQVPAGPRTLVFLVDDLALSVDGMNHALRTLRKFAREQVQPGDRLALLRTGVHVGTTQTIGSGGQFAAAIDTLHYNHARDAGPSRSARLRPAHCLSCAWP